MTRHGANPPLTLANAASPVSAVSQENPARFKMLDMLASMVGESSTRRTGFMDSLRFLVHAASRKGTRYETVVFVDRRRPVSLNSSGVRAVGEEFGRGITRR